MQSFLVQRLSLTLVWFIYEFSWSGNIKLDRSSAHLNRFCDSRACNFLIFAASIILLPIIIPNNKLNPITSILHSLLLCFGIPILFPKQNFIWLIRAGIEENVLSTLKEIIERINLFMLCNCKISVEVNGMNSSA